MAMSVAHKPSYKIKSLGKRKLLKKTSLDFWYINNVSISWMEMNQKLKAMKRCKHLFKIRCKMFFLVKP